MSFLKPKLEEMTKKQIAIRIVIVVLLLAIGIFFTGRAIVKYFTKAPGWDEIELDKVTTSQSETLFPYYDDISVYMYFDTQEKRSSNYNHIKELTQASLAKTHKLTDTYYSYDGVNNLKYLNEHAGTEVVLDDYLYEALKEAYQYSKDTAGMYNVFAGTLYDTWWNYFYSDAQSRLSDDKLTERVNEYESAAKTQLAYADALIFNDSKSSVVFNYADGCDGLVALNLQSLRNSYAIDALKETLLTENYWYGYISSADGISTTLGDHPQSTTWTTRIYDPSYTVASELANIYKAGSFNCYVFDNTHGEAVYKNADGSIIRHLLFSATETEPSDLLHLSLLMSDEKSLQELILETMKVLYSADLTAATQELGTYSDAHTYGVAIYNEGTSTAYDKLKMVVSSETKEVFKIQYNESMVSYLN